jgi:hypothetical protein
MVVYLCDGVHEPRGPHRWSAPLADATGAGAGTPDGVTDELLDPLLRCVRRGEPFVEYGIVEYRLRQERPDLFAAHVREAGHTMLAPAVSTASSVRFGVALGRLEREGDLLSMPGAATGAWRYNGTVRYWARPPAPTGLISWVDFCTHEGRPAEWTDEDRDAVRRMVAPDSSVLRRTVAG